ncbi:thymine dioxygenase [Fomitopsis betulina]|nr:thymine dioxygenase [Fomitopsis betulina]
MPAPVTPPSSNSAKLGDVNGISFVDFAPFLDGSNKQAVADAVLDSFKSVGLVYLVNYGLPKDKVDSMFDWSRKFFALPMETKMLAPHPVDIPLPRGYSPPGQEKLSQHVYDKEELAKLRAQAPDVKEVFDCGREDDPIPNIWLPDGILPGFKEASLDFFWSLRKVELSILRALSVGLHLDEDYLGERHAASDNQLRLLRYPSIPIEQIEKNEVERIGTHSDFISITLLLQDGAGGLEAEDPKNPGTWIAATPVEGAIVVNAGDFMMRWSNDMIKSPVHRVRAPEKRPEDGIVPERYSIPYFCSTDFSRVVDCLPGTYSETNPKKYEPISAHQYVLNRLSALY